MTTTNDNDASTTSDKTKDNSKSKNPAAKVTYRKARAEDLPSIAALLERSFPGDENEKGEEEEESTPPPSSSSSSSSSDFWSWTKNPFFSSSSSSSLQEKENEKQQPTAAVVAVEDETQRLIQMLQQRLTLPQHVLIVAVVVVADPSSSSSSDNDNDSNNYYNKVVGFMELGTMPAPISIHVPVNIPSRRPGIVNGINNNNNNEDQEFVAVRPERPYLANLAVDPDYRRQQMGSKLVQLAIKVATQWESAKANAAGVNFYFHPSSSSPSSPSSSSSSSKEGYNNDSNDDNNDNSTRLLLKLSTLYLSVDCDNEGAIAFYKRLQFTTVLDEAQQQLDEQLKQQQQANNKQRRTPKLYLEKELILDINTVDS
ncbi:unnamed protein product [Cylindrotheca closterium]|uniref:N-acetyltransferase domain-containing protein n=1 Tax=Cylindrotheca closterium TaxID=2856 RepID=A0AAD2CK88_9STRA|nr:unnamed protein product [Cylindrotheca closterium]